MNEFVINPFQDRQLPQPLEPVVLSADDGFIDENIVRQMILDGSPDNLPRTGNPSLPSLNSQEAFHRHPLAFAG